FEPCHGLLEPRQRVGKVAQRPGLSPPALMHLLVFLKRPDMRWARHVEKLRPLRPRHLADIEVAARIDGEPVRPEKGGRRGSGLRIAEARQELALMIDDADP